MKTVFINRIRIPHFALLLLSLFLFTACPTTTPPSINLVHPNNGFTEGGDRIEIHFSAKIPKDLQVTVGGAPCIPLFFSDTSIVCMTPSHAPGHADVIVRQTSSDEKSTLLAHGYFYRPQLTYSKPTPTELAAWSQAAQLRIEARNRVPLPTPVNWGANESIMTTDTTRRFIESVNRLEIRYPQAIPYSQWAFQEAFAMVKHARSRSAEGEFKKQAALRFLRRFLSETPNKGLAQLDALQFISLSWFAIGDTQIFQDQLEQVDRKKALIEAFATIQRAHNDQGLNGTMIWDPGVAPDRVSCPMGTSKRLLEHLDLLHPDVSITSLLPSPAEVLRDIRLESRTLFPEFFRTLSEGERKELDDLVSESDPRLQDLPAYIRYREALRERVRKTSPIIPEALIEMQTGPNSMMVLIEEGLDAYEAAVAASGP